MRERKRERKRERERGPGHSKQVVRTVIVTVQMLFLCMGITLLIYEQTTRTPFPYTAPYAHCNGEPCEPIRMHHSRMLPFPYHHQSIPTIITIFQNVLQPSLSLSLSLSLPHSSRVTSPPPTQNLAPLSIPLVEPLFSHEKKYTLCFSHGRFTMRINHRLHFYLYLQLDLAKKPSPDQRLPVKRNANYGHPKKPSWALCYQLLYVLLFQTDYFSL